MNDLDRLLELEIIKDEQGLDREEEEERNSLKSKIEQDLEYWQKYKDETREVEHIIAKRNLELEYVKRKINELEQQNKQLKENGNYAFLKSMEWKHTSLDYKQKLEKIEALTEGESDYDGEVTYQKLKEILKENK